MANTDVITDLERQLVQAKQAASPVIVEKTEETRDKIVYVNRTTGTLRVDLRGGTAPQHHAVSLPTIEPEVPVVDRPVDKAWESSLRPTMMDGRSS